jgi:hypothetical protein
MAYQGKGDKAQAKAAFERSLKWPRLPSSAKKEAEKRIAELS